MYLILKTFGVGLFFLLNFSAIGKIEGATMEAVQVLGQSGWQESKPGRDAVRMSAPNGLATDGTRLFVSEYQNRRILIFNTIPTKNAQPADQVIGQIDFRSNQEKLAADGFGGPGKIFIVGTQLFVTDFTYNRILVYNQLPKKNNAAADWVLGQPDFETSTAGLSAQHLNKPVDVTSDGKKLVVSDYGNNRVLIYNSIPTGNEAKADVVIGQPDFFQREPGIGRNQLKIPQGVYCDGQRLYVADSGNNRVLIFNQIPTKNFAEADIVLGQPDFQQTESGSQAGQFHEPDSLYSENGRLFISDLKNHRVLVWNSLPARNGVPADFVIGQKGFGRGTSGVGADRFVMPRQLLVIQNQLYVADRGNHRVLIFKIPHAVKQG